MRPRQEEGLSDPPQRIMIVCASALAIDQLLDKLSKAVPNPTKHIVRLGQSATRQDLNQKYTLEATKKNDAAAYERV